MVNYARVQSKIDKGLGPAGRALGQPFNVYRITASSSGDFPNGWTLIQASYPLYRKRTTENKIDVGQKVSGILWFNALGDMSPFTLADIFYQTDASYAPGASYGAGATLLADTLEFVGFCFCWHRPVMEGLLARINMRGQIFRPNSDTMQLADGSTYWAQAHDDDLPLVLTNGQFAFGTPGTVASYVPIGVGNLARPYQRPGIDPATPGVTPISWYYFYVPPLPGYKPTEGDAIILEDGSRYWITNPFSQESSVVGDLLVCERLISQVL